MSVPRAFSSRNKFSNSTRSYLLITVNIASSTRYGWAFSNWSYFLCGTLLNMYNVINKSGSDSSSMIESTYVVTLLRITATEVYVLSEIGDVAGKDCGSPIVMQAITNGCPHILNGTIRTFS